MTSLFPSLFAVLALCGSPQSARGSTCPSPSRFHSRIEARDSRLDAFRFPPEFERELGVSWDGKIEWKAAEPARRFATALEGSLKGISRTSSPYRLSVAVVRVETQTGTFVVEFSIQAPTGESVELLQIEGACPSNRPSEDIYPAVAGEIVSTFEKSVLK